MKTKVFVTGSTSGVGQAIAERLLERDFVVYFHGRDPENIQSLLKRPQAHFVRYDLRDVNNVQTIVSLVKREGIRCFVNNAGVYSDRGEMAPTPQCLDLLLTNLVAPILILKDVYKHYKKTGGGTLVNINSVAGLYPKYEEAIYCASKFGLRGFSDSLQLDAYKCNVRILDYYLGALKTRMARNHDGFDTLIDPRDVAEKIVDDLVSSRSYVIVRQELRKTSGSSYQKLFVGRHETKPTAHSH